MNSLYGISPEYILFIQIPVNVAHESQHRHESQRRINILIRKAGTIFGRTANSLRILNDLLFIMHPVRCYLRTFRNEVACVSMRHKKMSLE